MLCDWNFITDSYFAVCRSLSDEPFFVFVYPVHRIITRWRHEPASSFPLSVSHKTVTQPKITSSNGNIITFVSFISHNVCGILSCRKHSVIFPVVWGTLLVVIIPEGIETLYSIEFYHFFGFRVRYHPKCFYIGTSS